KTIALAIKYIYTEAIRCITPHIRSALKYRSAISPTINGAIMAPQDWVAKAEPIWVPVALRLLAKKVPSVTNQAPQTKNSRNIITLSFVCSSLFIEHLIFNVIPIYLNLIIP